MKQYDPLIAAAIDAAFSVIQAEHDPENRFDSGSAGDAYADRFPEFETLAMCLAHFSAWEAKRVKAAQLKKG